MAGEAPIDAIRRLLRLAERYQLAELEVEENGIRVTIRGAGQSGALAAPVSPAPFAPQPTASPVERPGQPAAPALLETERTHAQLSPMTGTFYRAEAPELPPLVEVGQIVEEGQTVGLIEAMKVFSAVPADRSGRVAEILARNGQLLQEGDPILILDLPF
jgi:acetyl-CoA carboxylase biotin carboxyl carrier protein